MRNVPIILLALALTSCGLPRDIVGPTDGGPPSNERPPNRG